MIIEKLINQNELSETEKQIAHYLLNGDHSIEDMTSSELGRRSYTSQSAVIRLYKKLGLRTYREFISKILIERESYLKTMQLIENKVVTYENILAIMSSIYKQTILNTNTVLDKNSVIRLCNRISSSSVIDVYSLGKSESIGMRFASQLRTLGLYCCVHTSFNSSYIQNYQDNKQKVILIIAVEEADEYLLNSIKLMREKNYYIVSLSRKNEKELVKICKDNLHFEISGYEDYKNISNVIGAEYVLNIVYSLLLLRKKV